MKKAFLLSLLFCVSVAGALSPDERLDQLSKEHQTWLEHDVGYIITERERDLFLSLETLEERNHFTEAFWRKRDPNPATPVNEFREEHYHRIEYANKFLGRDTFKAGWRTDRGRFHIILGKPRDISRFSGYSDLAESELWFYQGDVTKGVPAFFYLLFFKRYDSGEYFLYSPVIDGPSALLRGNQYMPGAEQTLAIERLLDISPELAHASLSFDTSEPADFLDGRPALGTDIMISRIVESPKRAISTEYADAWLRYGRRVSADYSFNYVPSRSTFAVLVGPESTPFVHFAVEIDPQNFALESDEKQTKFYTTLDITIDVKDTEGNLVVAVDSERYLELNPSQVQQVKKSPFSYQDQFPLVPGDYDISVILRNRVIKRYTVAEAAISIPTFYEGKPILSDVIVGFDTNFSIAEVRPDQLRAFQIGSVRVQPAVEGLFAIGETVHFFTQAYAASSDYRVRFDLLNGEEVLQSVESPVHAEEAGAVVDQLTLEPTVVGNYRVRARLLASDDTMISESSTLLVVSPRTTIPREAFRYRGGFNADAPGILNLARGEQLWNRGRFDEAEAEFEKAVAENNLQLPNARWKLAGSYLRKQHIDEAYELLAPLEEQFSQQYEVVAGLGFVHYFRNEDAKAVEYLDRAQAIQPPDAMLLNILGDIHQRLGQLDKAREAFEHSLQLNPHQPMIKEQLATVRSGENR